MKRSTMLEPYVAGVRSAERTAVVVALGDSITAGTPAWDPDPNVRRTISAPLLDDRHQWPYWAEQFDARLAIENRGVNRERTDEIVRRINPMPQGATVLIIQGGINDLVQGRKPEVAAANIRALVMRVRPVVPIVAVADVLPWNRGYPDHDAVIRKLNAWIAELATEANVWFLPFFATLEDSARPGRMREEWTSDGNHPSVEGHRLLGELVASVVVPALQGLEEPPAR